MIRQGECWRKKLLVGWQDEEVPSAESQISPVSTPNEFPGTSSLSTERSSLFEPCLVTAAGADLM